MMFNRWIENLWNFVKMKLEEEFPERDYNRSITVHDIVFPTVYWEFKELLNEKIRDFLKLDVDEIKADLETYEGIINDVDAEERRIDNDLMQILEDDESFEPIIKGLNRLIAELNKIK